MTFPRHPHHDPDRRRFHHPEEAYAEDGRSGRGHGHGPGPHGGPFGPGGPGGPGGRGRRFRAPRGDVRAAVLTLLAEEPMHGYQLMQAIADRSGGRWTPSPGAIYPAISQLEDEGLVTVTAESGRKVAALTDAGRAHVAQHGEGWPDPFGSTAGNPDRPDLRDLVEQLIGATRQVGRTGTDAQVKTAATILADARRAMYLLLADGPGGTDA